MKRKSPLNTLLIAVIGIALLLSACGGESKAKENTEVLQPTPTLVTVGSIPGKPVPFGYDIILEDLVISISEIARPADGLVSNSGAATPTPDENQEYLLVRITNQCVKMGFDDCFVGAADYQLMDADGNLVAPVSATSGMEGFFSFTEFSIGTSNKGFLAFLVEKGTDFPLMVYRTLGGEQVYLALAN